MSLLTIKLVGKADFSHSLGMRGHLDFSTLISGNLVVSLSNFGSRQWIRSTANWLARTD